MTSTVPPAAPDNRGEPFGPALASLGGSFAATAKSPLLVESAADVYRFLIGQFNAMDTGDFARLVDGDRTNPVDVLRGVREALRLYAIIPLRKDATTIPSPVPPAPEGVPVTLWRGDYYEGFSFFLHESKYQPRDEWKALPVIPFNAMSAYAKTGEEVEGVLIEANLDDCETTPGETVRALMSRLAAAEGARDEAVGVLKYIASHRGLTLLGDGTYSDGVHDGWVQLADAADAALKRDGEG